MGFSAGAMVTSGTLLQPDASARPNFAAMIYGGPFGAMPAIPAKLPPTFLAWAHDDALAKFAVKFLKWSTRVARLHVGQCLAHRLHVLRHLFRGAVLQAPSLKCFFGRQTRHARMELLGDELMKAQ